MATRLLVTGALGHLGRTLVPRLLARGHDVVALDRAAVRPGQGFSEGAELIVGDAADPSALQRALGGCEAVVHLAAVFRHEGTEAEIVAPTLNATQGVFDAAAKAGVRRIVFASSTAAVGASEDGRVLTEADWNDAATLPYVRAKVESEKLAQVLAQQHGLSLAILNPTGLLGPLDFSLTPTTHVLRRFVTGVSPTGTGGNSFADVRDVADAFALAVERPAVVGRTILGGENLTYAQLGRLLRALTGHAPWHLPVPRKAALALSAALGPAFRLAGKEPPYGAGEVRQYAGRYAWYDSTRAQALLGYRVRPARECVADALRWLVARQALPRAVCEALRGRLPPPAEWTTGASPSA